MRIEQDQLEKITGYKTPGAQKRWFKENLGADVPRDKRGPIISETTYELLMQRRMGILLLPSQNPAPLPPESRTSGPKLLKGVRA